MSRLANVFSALNNSDSDDDGYTKVVHKKKDFNAKKTNLSLNNKKNDIKIPETNKFSLKNHKKTIDVNTQFIDNNSDNIESIKREPINFDEYGKTKLNTPWCIWFHHDSTDWSKNGYKKIATFETVHDYVRIMTHLHMVTSIKNMSLCLFREGIEPTWEHKANSNGAYFKIKSNMELGFDLWLQICSKSVTETLLKNFGEIDVNGTINGIAVTNKASSKIIKIWVSDRKVSNYQWIDKDILSKLSCKVLFESITPEH